MHSKAEIRAIISTCVDENTIDSAPVSSRGNVVTLSPDETGSTAIEVLRANEPSVQIWIAECKGESWVKRLMKREDCPMPAKGLEAKAASSIL